MCEEESMCSECSLYDRTKKWIRDLFEYPILSPFSNKPEKSSKISSLDSLEALGSIGRSVHGPCRLETGLYIKTGAGVRCLRIQVSHRNPSWTVALLGLRCRACPGFCLHMKKAHFKCGWGRRSRKCGVPGGAIPLCRSGRCIDGCTYVMLMPCGVLLSILWILL
jgi:hypothetical protein